VTRMMARMIAKNLHGPWARDILPASWPSTWSIQASSCLIMPSSYLAR
jgi:hypothetical protein